MKDSNIGGCGSVIILFLFIFFAGCWCTNLVIFLNSDFDPIDKNEIVHGIGVFAPPLSVFTVWYD